MVVDPNANVEWISSLVKSHVGDEVVERQHGQELDYMLPLGAVNKFPGRYRSVPKPREEIFLNIGSLKCDLYRFSVVN